MAGSDTAQLTALYDAHAAPLWRFVVSLTHDHAGADDIVQETLLRAWKTKRILHQDPEQTRAWMFTVAKNLVIDEVRSARKRREVSVGETPERSSDDTDAILDAMLIQDALAGLSEDHRTVIVAAYYGGQSIGEVARNHGIPEGTVKSRLHYGLRALRLAFQEKGVTR